MWDGALCISTDAYRNVLKKRGVNHHRYCIEIDKHISKQKWDLLIPYYPQYDIFSFNFLQLLTLVDEINNSMGMFGVTSESDDVPLPRNCHLLYDTWHLYMRSVDSIYYTNLSL